MFGGDVTLYAEFTPAYSIAVANTENGHLDMGARKFAGEGERVAVSMYDNIFADDGYKFKTGSIGVTKPNGDPVDFNANYSEFFMPASDVVIAAEVEPLPKLDGSEQLSVTAGDTEAFFAWTITAIYKSWVFNYRVDGTSDAYKTASYYAGGLQPGAAAVYTLTGLQNDTKYEVFMSMEGATSQKVFVTPQGIVPTGVKLSYTDPRDEPGSSGSGASLTYIITTPEELLWWVNKINTTEHTTVNPHPRATLYANIDLTGKEFNGIGTADNPLMSLFGGNGYSVTYNMTQTANGAAGFIRYLGNGTVNSLTTRGTLTVSDGTVNAGGIVGQIVGSGNVSGCTNYVNITATGNTGGNYGGLAGYVDSTTTNFAGAVGNSTTMEASGRCVVG